MAPAAPPAGSQMPDFRVTPLIPSPDGVYNFDNPESRAPMAIAISGIMLGFMVIALILRFYARFHVLRNIGWDDWVGLVGAVFTAEYTVYAMVLFTMPGMGPHMWNIPGIVFMDTKFGLRLLFTEIMYVPSAYFVKLSILLLYKRIFVAPGGKSKYFIMGGIYASSLAYLVLFILSFAFCTKSQSLVDGGACHSKGAYVGWALAAVNVVTDVYLLAIPPFVIAQLHISTARKWQIASIFLLGIAATIASIISLYYRTYVSNNSMDFSWNIMPAAITSIVELNLGVVCSCLPAMNVLFHKRTQPGSGKPGASDNGSRIGWSFQHLMSRISNRTRLTKNASYGEASSAASHEQVHGDRDIVKLLEIQQYSVKTGPPSTQSAEGRTSV